LFKQKCPYFAVLQLNQSGMKKRIILLSATALVAFFTLSSYQNGPAAAAGLNLTGAKGSGTTCGGGGCHGGTSANTTVSIVVDSAGVPVTHYRAGSTYTVNITGSNTSHNPKFGFQFASVSGNGTSQVQAGNFTTLPANVDSVVLNGLVIVEHDAPLAAVNNVYTVSFPWVAPATQGTGTISMYCTLNAVNGDGIQNSVDLSNNTMISLTERVHTASIEQVSNQVQVTAYPNPVTNMLHVAIPAAKTGAYTVRVTDVIGREIYNKDIITAGAYNMQINTSNWAAGIYHVSLQGAGNGVVTIVKQ
jgi:hypothetical protein